MFYPKSPFLRYPLLESQLCRGNLSILEDLLQWLCQAPAITTYRVNTLNTSQEKFKSHVEFVLQERYECPPKVYTMSDLPEVVCIGPVEKTTPPCDEQKEIIVDSCCGAAVLRGAHIYSIGVLAMESGSKIGDKVNVFCDLEGKCKKGLNVPYKSEQKIYLGQGKIVMQRYQIYRAEGPMHGIAVEMLNTISAVPSIGDLSGSKALLQNLPSIVCVKVLGPQKGELILDMCSAPGNKTTHIAELTQDQATIIALDKTRTKIQMVQRKIEQNGYDSIRAFAFDSTNVYASTLEENAADWSPPYKKETFNRILLDAPCSALGNRPLLSSNISPKMLESYPKVQKKLFANAVPLLKVGGILIYSTCTVNIQENEEIVAWALEKYTELVLVDCNSEYGGPGWPCVSLTEEHRLKVKRFGSDNKKAGMVDTVGFFIAKFQKLQQ